MQLHSTNKTHSVSVVEYCEMKGNQRLLDRKIFLRLPNNVLPLGDMCFNTKEAAELAVKSNCYKKDVLKVAETRSGVWSYRYLILDPQGLVLLENGQKIKIKY